MVQQSLIYSFVARGTVVLAEHTDFIGNFPEIALQCLQRLPATNTKFTYNTNGHTFNYLALDGFTYCIVAVESFDRHIAMAFLERIREDFTKRYGGGKAATATSKSLNKEFGPKLKEHMQYCVEHPEEVSQLARVKAQLLNREVKIDVLMEKTGNLHNEAQVFRGQGDQLRRKMWFQNMKIKLIILAIIIVIILIIVLVVR
ncbi:hypothetical protein TSUD_176350 [Trifolium subterraneum]|uniref:Longin domain-containing protein n=1 Tax=Trifolium subterraneum TaxID=3900 RepID=A0A2Z6NYU8_TRISU|nr:hypothetical protein TSUD_176350 [Trifolium subterraneum]